MKGICDEYAFLPLLAGILSLGMFVSQAVAISGGEVDEDNTYSNVWALVFTGKTRNQKRRASDGCFIPVPLT
jgi:hypothetical protein